MVRPLRIARGFTLIELMMVIAIIGVLAALAIPALMQTVRRSKTSEATVNIRRIFDGAITSYQTDVTTRVGNPMTAEFPGTVGATPGENKCCENGFMRCPADATAFDQLTWHKLQFSVDDPHYYWYSFDSSGAGSTAAFTARANGNLDCDDIYSTFERVGFVDLMGSVTGGAGVHKTNVTE